MSLPELQPAELGGVEGSGYAFTRSTHDGDTVQGIFFAGDASEEQVGALVDEDVVTFNGVLYKRNRSGSMSRKVVELHVDVTKKSSVAFGDRLDFIEVTDTD
ncbi:MAG: hypothetical protein R3178_07000 [Rhodothermales bacterium]|nr:hypothetical protein [Rhodothermales bacterium]